MLVFRPFPVNFSEGLVYTAPTFSVLVTKSGIKLSMASRRARWLAAHHHHNQEEIIMGKLTRRDFAKTAVVAGATTALSYSRIVGANDRVKLGFIALGNRGDQVLDAFLEHKDCEVTAVCDIYQPYMDFASKKIGSNPKQFKDYRKLIELKDVDAAGIFAPDHWHALQNHQARPAGKKVYAAKTPPPSLPQTP